MEATAHRTFAEAKHEAAAARRGVAPVVVGKASRPGDRWTDFWEAGPDLTHWLQAAFGVHQEAPS